MASIKSLLSRALDSFRCSAGLHDWSEIVPEGGYRYDTLYGLERVQAGNKQCKRCPETQAWIMVQKCSSHGIWWKPEWSLAGVNDQAKILRTISPGKLASVWRQGSELDPGDIWAVTRASRHAGTYGNEAFLVEVSLDKVTEFEDICSKLSLLFEYRPITLQEKIVLDGDEVKVLTKRVDSNVPEFVPF